MLFLGGTSGCSSPSRRSLRPRPAGGPPAASVASTTAWVASRCGIRVTACPSPRRWRKRSRYVSLNTCITHAAPRHIFPPFAVFPHRTRQSPCRTLAEGGELTQSYHETSSVEFCGGTLDPLRVAVLLCVYTCTVDIINIKCTR